MGIGSNNRAISEGVIVDYILRDGTDRFDICVWFNDAKVNPITMQEEELIGAGIDILIGRGLLAIINPDADEEHFVRPKVIEPL